MADGMFLGREGAADLRISPDRLTTHGVVLGMTGSGKTGLCLVLLEELVAAGVPIIAIDPKGDLGNLGLVFPGLSAPEFAPWTGPQDPAETATRWREGLGRWGLGVPEVARLRAKMHLHIYTPGSEAGTPVNVLGSFARPAAGTMEDPEARRDLVGDTISGLLGLVGRASDPIRDPAHLVLSQVLDQAWAAGEDPTLETLILRLVDPPFQKVGVFPLDRFFPPKDRMDLAMELNTIAASPSFAAWAKGAVLDLDRLLARGPGPVPVHLFTIAHLDEKERQFFVSLLLGHLLAWSRRQPGSEQLRALVFMDEVAGYLPPHPRQPPTKAPLLTMMKQARAVGLGVVLSTQNPVDVDYKALSNAGLWLVGRLNTAQDRDRVLEGIGRRDLDGQIAGLEKRQFLLHDVRALQPRVLSSRHAMCYLRGPFTKVEIGRLAALHPTPVIAEERGVVAPAPVEDGLLPAPPPVPGKQAFLDPRVAHSARLADAFASATEPRRADGATVWRPALHADLELRFDEDKAGFVLDHHERRIWFPLGDRRPTTAQTVEIEADDLLDRPEGPGRFAPLPDWMDEARELAAIEKEIVDEVYRTETAGMLTHPGLKLYGKAGEDRAAFEARVQAAIEERIDDRVAKLQAGVKVKIDRLQDKIVAKEQKLQSLAGDHQARKLQEAVNIGETLLSFFSGRKKSLSTAMNKRHATSKAGDRIEETEAEVERLKEEAVELGEELETQVAAIRAEEEAALAALEEREVRLEKSDIRLLTFGVLWIPVSRRI